VRRGVARREARCGAGAANGLPVSTGREERRSRYDAKRSCIEGSYIRYGALYHGPTMGR